MKTRLILLTGLVVLALARPGSGQVPTSPPPPLDSGEVALLFERSLDTQIVLSAGPGVGSGYYSLDETDAEITRLAVTVRWPRDRQPPADAEPASELDPASSYLDRLDLEPHVRLRVRVGLGNAEMTSPVPFLRDYGAEGELLTSTYSYRGGVGLDLQLGRVARLTPMFHVAWSKATGIAGGDPIARAILGLYYDEVLVNWRMEAITLMPGVQAALAFPVDPLRLEVNASATYLHSRTLSATSELQEIQTNSLVLRTSLGIDIPLRISLFGYPLHLKPGLGHIFLAGDARAGAGGSKHYLDPFLTLVARTESLIARVLGDDAWPRMTQLGVTGHVLLGDRTFGWNVGVAVAFDL